MCNRKSPILTYVLSLIGGFFGLHHLYLGRTQHALLWLTTFGGFGVGLVYEIIFSLSKYIREANDDHLIIHEYRIRILQKKSPAFEVSRFCSKLININKTIIKSFRLPFNRSNEKSLL